MTKDVGVRGARSIPATESAAVDDPWLEDQTTTKYTRVEREPAAHETDAPRSAERKAGPSWSPVFTACVGAASCLVFGQMIWSARALPSTAALRQLESAEALPSAVAADTTDASPRAVDDAMSASAATVEQAPAAVPAEANATHAVSTKRREQAKRRRRAAVGVVQPDGLPATMRIDSYPWSDVTVDGNLIGRTPQQKISLTPGKHRVLLHNPDRDVLKILVLHVLPGETIERVEQLGESQHQHGQP